MTLHLSRKPLIILDIDERMTSRNTNYIGPNIPPPPTPLNKELVFAKFYVV